MRLNVYTEELLTARNSEIKSAEVVTAEYVSSRTGEPMKNYGLRIYFKSHPDLHYVPPRDDDRSAVTIWCGDKEQNVINFLDMLRYCAEQSNLERFREKRMKAADEAEVAETARRG